MTPKENRVERDCAPLHASTPKEHNVNAVPTGENQGKSDLSVGIHDFLAEAESDYDWLIPDLFERGDRVVVAGRSATGKSEMLRQVAVCVAAGRHPFDVTTAITPARVLLVDIGARAEGLRAGVERVQGALPPVGDNLTVFNPDGSLESIWAGLGERVSATQPDLICIDSIWDLSTGRDGWAITSGLDRLRAICGSAMWLEHISDGGRPADRAWLYWPDFGFLLNADGDAVDFTPYRGSRDERSWPKRLTRGGVLPWSA